MTPQLEAAMATRTVTYVVPPGQAPRGGWVEANVVIRRQLAPTPEFEALRARVDIPGGDVAAAVAEVSARVLEWIHRDMERRLTPEVAAQDLTKPWPGGFW